MASINEKDRSFMFLMSSVGKDYFTFKMKIEPLITNSKAAIYTQDNFEFLCDLILKQHLYINELETKTKGLIDELSTLKQTLEEKEKMIKSLNDNVINVFIKSNYEQEQMITKFQQEIETLKLNWKIKGNYNNTLSNIGLSGLTTAREDNKSNVSKRESKEEKGIANVLFKNNNNNNIQTNSPLQSHNQSLIIHHGNNQQTKTKKGINVYLHKEKLKLMHKSNNSNNTNKKKCQNSKSCFSQQYLQTSLKHLSNESRNNSNRKHNSSFTFNNNSINNSVDCKLIRAKINKMKLNLNSMFGSFSIGSKKNKMRQNSSIY